MDRLSRLLEGQGRIETDLARVQHGIEILTQVTKQLLASQRVGKESGELAGPMVRYHSTSEPVGVFLATSSMSPSPHANGSSDGEMPARPLASTRFPTEGSFTHCYKSYGELMSAMRTIEYANVQRMLEAARGSGARHGGRISKNSVMIGHPVVHRVKCLPLHPMCWQRILFDVSSLVVLMVEAFVVPYLVAWAVPLAGWALAVQSSLAGFWTVDIILSCATGFQHEGEVIMDWQAILHRYLTGGFIMDLLVLLPEYTELIIYAVSPHQGSSFRLVRFLRILKVTRLARLIRAVAKLRRGMLGRFEMMLSYALYGSGLRNYRSTLLFAWVLIKLMMLIVFLCHFMACAWYFLEGLWEPHTENLWLNHDGESYFRGSSSYPFALYWAVTTMFSGASFIAPLNVAESVYASVCITFSALFVAAVTSNLAAILIDAQESGKELKKKISTLDAFMDQTGTPFLLAIAVRENFIANMAQPPRLTEQDVPHLRQISRWLQSRIRHCSYAHLFLQLPMLRVLDALQPAVVEELCYKAASQLVATEGDRIFSPGKTIPAAFLTTSDGFQYTWLRGDSHIRLVATGGGSAWLEPSGVPVAVAEDSWICELALLMEWRTVGTLTAETACDLLQVSVEAFMEIIMVIPQLAVVAASCADVVQYMSHDVATDLHASVDYDLVLAKSHSSIRELISMPCLESLKRQHGGIFGKLHMGGRKDMEDLEAEVRAGKTLLVANPELEITRVIRVIVLRLRNADGRICVKLAEWIDGVCIANFQMPGRSMRAEESEAQTARNTVIKEEFSQIEGGITVDEVPDVVSTEMRSASFGVVTKYFKFTYSAFFDNILKEHFLHRSEHSPKLSPKIGLSDTHHFSGATNISVGTGITGVRHVASVKSVRSMAYPTDHLGSINERQVEGAATTTSALEKLNTLCATGRDLFALQMSSRPGTQSETRQKHNHQSRLPLPYLQDYLGGKQGQNGVSNDGLGHFHIYTWMEQAEIDALSEKPHATNMALSAWAAALSVEDLRALLLYSKDDLGLVLL